MARTLNARGDALTVRILVTGAPGVHAALAAALASEGVQVIDATDAPRTETIAESLARLRVVAPILPAEPPRHGPQHVRKGKARRW